VATVFTLHAGEAVVQVPAIEVPVNNLLAIRTEKSIQPFILMSSNIQSIAPLEFKPYVISSNFYLFPS